MWMLLIVQLGFIGIYIYYITDITNDDIYIYLFIYLGYKHVSILASHSAWFMGLLVWRLPESGKYWDEVGCVSNLLSGKSNHIGSQPKYYNIYIYAYIYIWIHIWDIPQQKELVMITTD